MKLSSEHLELILEVIDKGSFSAAARSLKRVPSAVSMSIANLEAELGFLLFERTKSHLKPTPGTLAIVPQARQIQSEMRQLQLHLNALSVGLESSLTLGIASDIDRALILPALAHLSEKYPFLRVSVRHGPQNEIKALLHNDIVDVCLSWSETDVNTLERFRLLKMEKFVATVSPEHPLLREPHLTTALNDLSRLRQIVVASSEQNIPDRRILLSAFCWFTDSLETAMQMVEQGLGWGNFPLSVASERIARGRLSLIEFDNTINGLAMPVHVTWRGSKSLGKAALEVVRLLSA